MRRGWLVALGATAAMVGGTAPAGAATAPTTYGVGIAANPVNPNAIELATSKVYLGGFGFGSPPATGGRPAQGVLGEGSSVRAFVVSDPSGGRFAIADMEVQGWFVAAKDGPYGILDMRRKVEQLTNGGLKAEQVVVQSDHSHSGPDGMGVWGGIPLSYRQRIFDTTVSTIVAAYENRRDGELYYGTADANPDDSSKGPNLINNQFSQDPNNQTLDDELRVLQARDPVTHQAFATMLNLSSHGTVLGESNKKVSGDWPQRANPMLEAAFGGQAMTVVGTLGRSQPNRPGCQTAPRPAGDAGFLCDLDAYSTRVVDRAKDAVARATALTGPAKVAAKSYLIQDPATNGLLLGVGAVGDPAGVPLNRSVLPPWLTGNVIGTITATARIGDVIMSSVPGEIYPQIAKQVRDTVGGDARGYMTAGLANDQLGYIIAPFPEAYGQPICSTALDNCNFDQVGPANPPGPDPLGNDNYFFNVSHTLGERVICSLLRGAGAVLKADEAAYRSRDAKCPAFSNDLAFSDGADTMNTDAPAPPDPGTITGNTAKGQVKAGVAVVNATWHVGAADGQYAEQRDPSDPADTDPFALNATKTPSYGFQARLEARALVTEDSAGKRIALVKNDLYIPQDLLYRRVAQLLQADESSADPKKHSGIGLANLTMAVTHDHSSPYYSSTAPGAWTFQDVYDVRFYEYYARRMADAVEKAASSLVPVRVGASVGALDKVHRHSFGPAIADDGTPAGYPVEDADHSLTVVRFDDVSDSAHPKPLAVLLNYSLHPEMLSGNRNNLISPDYVGPMQRMIDRETGATTIFTQSSVGTAEPERSAYHSIHERLEFTHKEYAQDEYAARLIADETRRTWNEVDSPAARVPFKTSFEVGMTDRWYPGPASHPYPGVSNCRSGPALQGDPRVPILGLPDCQNGAQGVLDGLADFFGQKSPARIPKPPFDPGVTPDDFTSRGIPIPANYSAPSYGALQEDLDVHLQAFRLGDILFTVCSCEQWKDQAQNIRSRTDTVRENQYLGYDWSAQCTQVAGIYTSCPNPQNPSGPRLTTSTDPQRPSFDANVKRMHDQVNNDAAGWDFLENTASAESEDPTRIKGNYTHEELAPDNGYKLTVPITMANDYNGYIATYREYNDRDAYRKALTAWGPHSSDYLATRLVQLGGHLHDPDHFVLPTEGKRELADTVGKPKTQADLASNDARAQSLGNTGEGSLAAFENTLPNDGGSARVVSDPKDVERFDAAFVRWNGGSNYTDDPVVRVERVVDGKWEPYADQSGEVVTTLQSFEGDDPSKFQTYTTGGQEWIWTAHFEAFASRFDTGQRGLATPPGRYRFVITGARREGGASKAYGPLLSRSFLVSPWSGITAEDLKVDAPDQAVSFKVGPRHTRTAPAIGGGHGTLDAQIGPIDYPDSYSEAEKAKFIEDKKSVLRDPAALDDPSKLEWFCLTCTFRPWVDFGPAETAEVAIAHADGTVEKVPAHADGDRWVTNRKLASGESAIVGAGCVKDRYGNFNGAASSPIGAGATAGFAAAAACASSPPPPPNPEPEPGLGGLPVGTVGAAGDTNPGSPAAPGGGPVAGGPLRATPKPTGPSDGGRCTDRRRPVSHITRRYIRASRRGVSFRGFSSDRGCVNSAAHFVLPGKVARVRIAIARVISRGRCRFLGANGSLARTRDCRRRSYLSVRGTRRWSFAMRARFPRGIYRVRVIAVDARRNVELYHASSYLTFRIR